MRSTGSSARATAADLAAARPRTEAHEHGRVGLAGTGWDPVATKVAPQTTQAALPEGERPGQRGGAEGTRTPDPHTASVVRYQLRHSPESARLVFPGPSATVQGGAAGPRTGGG